MTMLPPDPLFVIRGDVSITCLLFSHSKKILYSGNLNGDIHVWSLETYRAVDKWSASAESVQALHEVDSEDPTVLTQDKTGCFALWSHNSQGKEAWHKTWSVSVDYLGFCQCRILDHFLLVPLSSAALQFFSLPSGEALHSHQLWGRETSGEIMALVPYTHNKENYVLVGSERGDIAVWEFSPSSAPCGTALGLPECVMTLAYDALWRRGAAAGPGGSITTFNVNETNDVVVWRVVPLPCAGVAALALRLDHRLLAAGCWDGKLRLFSWKSLVGLAVLASHDHSVQTVAFSAQTPFLMAGGCKDGRISLWDLYNKR